MPERYKYLTKQSFEGIYIFDPISKKILEANDSFLSMLGYSLEEITKLSVYDIMPYNNLDIDNNVKRALIGVVIRGNYQYKTKQGTIIDVNRSYSVINYNNSQVCLVNVRDKSRQKEAEKALQESYLKVKRMLDETVNALVAVAEKRDPYTAGHQDRVSDLACVIARKLKLPQQSIEGIYIAGKLHDIGKITVPSDILNKPGKLHKAEMEIIKIHPQASYEILSKIHFDTPVAQAVLQHHERLDGSGYPYGLLADDILLESRIISVADVVEAMISHRPYRPSIGLEAALEEINTNKGILYCPIVVDACMDIFKNKEHLNELTINFQGGESYVKSRGAAVGCL